MRRRFMMLDRWYHLSLRAFYENRINKNLKGYRIRLADVDVNPIDLNLVLKGLTIIQEKHPNPPVADF